VAKRVTAIQTARVGSTFIDFGAFHSLFFLLRYQNARIRPDVEIDTMRGTLRCNHMLNGALFSIPPEPLLMTHILILEGDRQGAALLVAILRLDGFYAATVATVEMALCHMRAPNPPAVLVVDLDLRDDGGGPHAARLAQLIDPGLNVIFLTSQPDAVSDYRPELGAYVLVKPFLPAQLESAIRAVRCKAPH
jgi:CheY-like chemotaxis protein